ncbi:ABC transporter permease [Homoserinibacter sp. YIM 151385]|uniref:ABC transporter permease n=1 Tax=Homoserinibacter sp. YIM 151385 TaxID=2985506 RepID=UPI0022F033CF|nr:ABC transporter permease [Homoserinibacter sp. YIM 151385]WBU38252.1 ABC transporter permease [Homoserinibacter sp. YIM 151385]
MTILRSIRSELLKLTTVRSTWILGLILFAYVGVSAAGFAGVLAIAEDDGGLPTGAGLHLAIYAIATSVVGYAFPLLIGAFTITGELRFQTLTPTFLATPARGAVLAGKVVASFLVGLVLGVVGLLASAGLGGLVLALTGQETGFDDPETWWMIGRAVLAMALWTIVGVGLGTLIPNQVAVIVIVIAFTQFIEPVLRVATAFVDWTAELGRFLPGAASDALVGSSFFGIIGAAGGVDPLEPWQGGLVMVGIAGVLLLLGGLTTWRRDVT